MSKPFDLDRTPFSVLDRRRTSLNRSLDECSAGFTASRGDTITRRDIENGLVAVLHLDEIFDLLHRDITTEEILALLADVDFHRLRSVTLCDVALDEAVLPDGLPLYVEEADVKLNGNKWTVHKYDADPFPSNPHAHNYPKNLKLHLGNGLLRQRTRAGSPPTHCEQEASRREIDSFRLVKGRLFGPRFDHWEQRRIGRGSEERQ